MLQQLKSLLWKNLIIRKRHWLLTLTEIFIPVLLFTLVAYGRSKISGLNKVHLDDPTFYDVSTMDDIYSHLDVGELRLLYTPHTYLNVKIIERVQEKLQIRGDAIQGFVTKEKLLEEFSKSNSSLVAIVNFKTDTSSHLDYELTLYDKYLLWDTNKLFLSVFTLEDARSSKYLYKGYAALQVAIDMAFIELSGENIPVINFSIQEFPDPPRTVDEGLTQLFMYFLPLITIFSFMFLCPSVLQRVGEEKHSGTKEFMKMVGISSWMIWLGWFIHALTTYLISIIAIVILMKVPFWGVSYPPIEYSDGTVLFVFLFMYCMAAITFCFFIGSVFNTPSVASVIGMLLWIFSYFVPQSFVRSHECLPWRYKIFLMLFPNMGLHFGYSSISVFEMREVGIQWYNIFQSSSGNEDDINMGNVFVMFIVNMIFFMLLTLYVENVKPGDYGIAQPYLFPITNLKHWIRNRRRVENSSESKSLNRDVEEGKTASIEIHDLFKKYKNHLAVENLNMNVYKNEITVLLGHNGAGKTTTMSILTGMISATSGYILIDGKDIRKHTCEVRKIMGLCPQHNLMFPDLTVVEHLQFYAMLKQVPYPRESAKDMLCKLGIENEGNNLACNLSGGTKRKLCLGIALIGDAQILILDEPTSGMDPESRRKIWDLLLKYRKSKTIFITTHFMEEADVLADRIAIMANGRLQCHDTPLRLKIKYDTGYHLSLFVKNTDFVEEITNTIKGHIYEARLIQQTDDTVIYLLPLNKEKSYGLKYRDLCKDLQNNKEEWGIVSIGLNLTTLNDVFLKVKDEVDNKNKTKVDGNSGKDLLNSPKLIGMARGFHRWFSLLRKRFYFLKKKFYWFIPSTLVALCIFSLVMWLALTNDSSQSGEPPLNFTLQSYGKTQVYYGGRNSTNPKIIKMRKLYNQSVVQEQGTPIFREDVSGAIIQMGIDNIAYYRKHMVVASEFNDTQYGTIVNAMYSPNSLHGLPISINLAMNALVKTLINETFTITTTNVPLKPLHAEFTPAELSVLSVMSVWLILMPFSALFLMSNFIIFPHTEVSTNFVEIQTFAGIRIYVYWLSNLLFDLLFATPLILIFVVLFPASMLNVVMYKSTIFNWSDIGVIVAIFACYIVTSMPFTYLLSYKKTLSGAFTLLLTIGIFGGIVPAIIVIAMELSHQEYYINIASSLKHVVSVFSPPFSLSYVIGKFAKKYVENFNWKYMDPLKRNFICQVEPNPCCFDETSTSCCRYQSYFLTNESKFLYDLIEMMTPFILYFLLLLAIPTATFKKFLYYLMYCRETLGGFSIKGICGKNNCIQNEKGVDTDSSATLCVKDLTKYFGRKAIVKDLKLYLKKNKCFGLLGVNGAGKSTTFRMLTKNIFFDKGEVSVSEGRPISINEPEYCEKIGYCPQENCLNYFLTGRELLSSMALLRGYSQSDANDITKHLLTEFELLEYADKPCSDYSGGNKRKLCTCVAFLGSPKIILLDEPTSGVDPASRAKFWSTLSYLKNTKDTSVLLCSHSMEECEKLCDEIAIMKNGEIKDQGSLLALKYRYQNGFRVTVKLKCTNTDQITSTKDEIVSRLNSNIAEEHGESITYEVKQKTLDEIFECLEDMQKKKENLIEDYFINQISLEDIFLSVAKENTCT